MLCAVSSKWLQEYKQRILMLPWGRGRCCFYKQRMFDVSSNVGNVWNRVAKCRIPVPRIPVFPFPISPYSRIPVFPPRILVFPYSRPVSPYSRIPVFPYSRIPVIPYSRIPVSFFILKPISHKKQ